MMETWEQFRASHDPATNAIWEQYNEADWNRERDAEIAGLAKTNAFYSANPQAFSQLGADQAAKIRDLSFGHPTSELQAYMDSIRPNNPNNIHGTGLASNGDDMWWVPQEGPRHTDNRGPLSAEAILTGGISNVSSEQTQSDWNDMRSGLAIMALPFAGYGITTAVGAGAAAGAGAGAAGAGAAEGGVAATGIDASTGLFAGESATSGAAGLGAAEGGALSGSTGSASLVGGAGSDTAASMPAAQAEADPFGGYTTDPNTGDVFYGTGDNPYGSNYSGGNTNDFFTGTEIAPGQTSPGMLQQAQAMAKQLGITPAAALQTLIKAAGRAAPAALGAVGANQQANSLSALADKYMAFGAPSRARYEASFAPGFTMMNDPGYKDALDASSKATLHGLSVGGNPAGSPNAWAQSLQDNYAKTAYPALQNFRNTNANAGGIASLQTAAPAAATGAIGAQGNVFNAIGAGVNDIFNPPQSLAQQLAEYQRLMKAQGSGAVV